VSSLSGTNLACNPTLARGTSPEFAYAQNISVFPPAKHDALGLNELLTAEERQLRLRVREFAELHVAPVIAGYWERAEFPFPLVPKIAELNIGGGNLEGYGCQGHSVMACAMAAVELVSFPAAVNFSCLWFPMFLGQFSNNTGLPSQQPLT